MDNSVNGASKQQKGMEHHGNPAKIDLQNVWQPLDWVGQKYAITT